MAYLEALWVFLPKDAFLIVSLEFLLVLSMLTLVLLIMFMLKKRVVTYSIEWIILESQTTYGLNVNPC